MYLTDSSQGFGVRVLYEEADHSLPFIVLARAPDRGAPPDDHCTWAVIAGVDGPEKSMFYERVDDRRRAGHAELRQVGEKGCNAGEVVAIPTVESELVEAVYRAPTHPYTRAVVVAIPDPMRRERLPRIRGAPRTPIDPDPRICRFDGRCPRATPRWREASPRLRPAGPGREVACHRAEV